MTEEFQYWTTVVKECVSCSYSLTHKKMDIDSTVANTRKRVITTAMDWCPYCSRLLVTRSYTFHAESMGVQAETIVIEETA